jgi:hypothetical protein
MAPKAGLLLSVEWATRRCKLATSTKKKKPPRRQLLYPKLTNQTVGPLHLTTALKNLIGTPSHNPLRVLVPPEVGEVGTFRTHAISPSEDVKETCNPVGPDAEEFPETDVA